MKYRAIPAGRDDDLADAGGNRTVPVGCRHHEVSVSVLVDVSGAADRLPQVVESTGSGVGIQERPIETGVDPYPAGFGKGIDPLLDRTDDHVVVPVPVDIARTAHGCTDAVPG